MTSSPREKNLNFVHKNSSSGLFTFFGRKIGKKLMSHWRRRKHLIGDLRPIYTSDKNGAILQFGAISK
jgi:hypothetical protein